MNLYDHSGVFRDVREETTISLRVTESACFDLEIKYFDIII